MVFGPLVGSAYNIGPPVTAVIYVRTCKTRVGRFNLSCSFGSTAVPAMTITTSLRLVVDDYVLRLRRRYEEALGFGELKCIEAHSLSYVFVL